MNPLVETGIELLVKPLIGELQAERKMQRQLKELAFKQRLDIETARVNQEMSFQYEQKLLEKKFQDNLALKEQDLRDRLKEWSDKEDFKNCWPLTNTYQNKALVAEPNSKNARPVRIFITLPEESNYLSVIKSVNKTLETYFSYSNFNPNSENPLTSRIGAWKEEKGFSTSNNINVLFQWLKLQPCIVINPVFRKDKADIYIYSWSPFYKENEPTPQRWFTWDIPENETGLEEKLTTSIALLIGFYTDLYHLVEIGAQPQMPMAFKKFCDENAFPYEIPEDIINSYKTTLYGITYTNWLGEKLPLTYLNMAKSLHSIGTDYAIQVSKQLFRRCRNLG